MKKLITSIFAAALVAVGFSQSFASVDMFLKIEDVKGETKIVKLRCSDGSCATSVDDMKAGKYTFTLTDAHGNALKMKAKEKANHVKSMSMNFAKITFEYEVKAPRDVATGQSSGKRSAPRDVATGQSSGKRQHGAVKIVKEIEYAKTFVAAGDVNGDGMLDLKISWTFTDGKTMGMDDWEAPVN